MTLFQKKENKNPELIKNIVKSCLNSTVVVLVCIITFETFFYINCWRHSKSFGLLGPWYRTCYMTLLIASIVGLCFVIYCRRDYDNRYRIIQWLSPTYSTLITAWALCITYLDCLKSAKCSPLLIMTILLCIPACVYINPYFYMCLDVVANVAMLSLLIWAANDGRTADILNYIVFMIIQIVVSRFLLQTKIDYYRSAQMQMEMKLKEEKLAQEKKQAEEMTVVLVKTLSDTIEAKDDYLRGHSGRVSEYAQQIAKEMGLPEDEIERIRYAASLHDIGKIGVTDVILNKPAKLTEEEYDTIKDHSTIGAEILQKIDVISYTSDIARHHHERYDGKGYPDGLKGEEISLGARIVAVADSFDAMNSRRVYRNPLEKEIIRAEIEKNKGIQFDPQVADSFLKLFDEGLFDKDLGKEDCHE